MKLKPAEIAFYLAIAVAVAFLLFPEFFLESLGGRLAPYIDKIATSWLDSRQPEEEKPSV